VKIVTGDANAKIGRETMHHPTIGKYSLHETTHENGIAAGRQIVIRSTYFRHSPDRRNFKQNDHHFMIDGRHFSDVTDVQAQRSANIGSDHILVVITLRAKICRAYTLRQKQQRRRFAVKTLKSKNVATQYCNELEYEFQSAHDVQTCSLNELWYDTE
jgi:hypothetical protein